MPLEADWGQVQFRQDGKSKLWTVWLLGFSKTVRLPETWTEGYTMHGTRLAYPPHFETKTFASKLEAIGALEDELVIQSQLRKRPFSYLYHEWNEAERKYNIYRVMFRVVNGNVIRSVK